MTDMRPFLRSVLVGAAVAIPGALVVGLADLHEAWGWLIALIAVFAASLADPEGFYGEPHPFSRHRRG